MAEDNSPGPKKKPRPPRTPEQRARRNARDTARRADDPKAQARAARRRGTVPRKRESEADFTTAFRRKLRRRGIEPREIMTKDITKITAPVAKGAPADKRHSASPRPTSLGAQRAAVGGITVDAQLPPAAPVRVAAPSTRRVVGALSAAASYHDDAADMLRDDAAGDEARALQVSDDADQLGLLEEVTLLRAELEEASIAADLIAAKIRARRAGAL